MDTAELLKKVRKIELKTRRLTRNQFTGGYHSAFKGRGMSFSEVRQYQFGDDVRAIDWNVTARSNDPHIKIFEEERELTLMLVVDISGSSFFGSTGQFKQELIAEICAVLAFSAESNNDKVGLLLFSDVIELYIAPSNGRKHTLRIIRELLNVKMTERQTNITAAIQYMRNVFKKRSVCFVLSDFMDDHYEPALKVLAKRHDCIGLHCWDPMERDLPDMGLIQIQPAEGGPVQWIDSGDLIFRNNYQKRFEVLLEKTAALFKRAGADFLSLQTNEAYAPKLMNLFEKRGR